MNDTIRTFQRATMALFLALSLAGFPSVQATYAQGAQPPAPAAASLSQAGVKALQEALNKQGVAVPVDGVLSEATRNAIRRFQSLHHLPVTGEADQATLDKLGVVAQRGDAPGNDFTVGQIPSSNGGSMMSPQGSMMSPQDSMNPGQGTAGMAGAPMMQGMMQMMQGMMGMMKGQMGGGPMGGGAMAAEPKDTPAPGGRMRGPMMQGMMGGMMQTMQGMMGIMQGQMQPGQARAEQMRPGRMFRERMQGSQDETMDCPMVSRADRTSEPAMMQMMQGMMQMMQMMQGQMQPGQER